MFRHKLSAVLFLSTLALYLCSCESSNVVDSNNQPSIKYLQKIYRDSANYTELSYKDNLLIKYLTVGSGVILSSHGITYNENNILLREILFQHGTNVTLNYGSNNAGIIDSAEILIGNNYDGFMKFIYNNQKQMIKREQYHKGENMPWNHFEYIYDSNGNMIERKFFAGEHLSTKDLFEYDNKINPSYNWRNCFPYEVIASNNITKLTTYEYYSNTETIRYTYFSYSYDNNEYPISRVGKTILGSSESNFKEYYEYR